MNYRLAEPDFDETDLGAVTETLRSGWLIQGKQVSLFESALGKITCSAPHVAVSSGTAALHLAMLTLEIGPGDLVYIPSLAWPSAANVALLLGALPIFIDVVSPSGNIDPIHLSLRVKESIQRKLGRPRAVVPVHAFGLSCDIERVVAIAKEYGLDVIEDAACSLGATTSAGESVGLVADIGIFSFHPRKSLTTGEGGSIISRRPELLDRCRQLRDHGRTSPMTFVSSGLNSRMTEFQAALGIGQAQRFPKTLAKRRQLAEYYLRELKECPCMVLQTQNVTHTWQTFFILTESSETANQLRKALAELGIEAGFPSHSAQSLPQFASLPGTARMPVSEQLRDCGVALPLHARLNERDINTICEAVQATMKKLAAIAHRESKSLVS